MPINRLYFFYCSWCKKWSINDPQNDFRVCGRKIFESSFYNAIRQTLNFLAPKLMTVFRIKVADPSVKQFIRSVVKQNFEYRDKNDIGFVPIAYYSNTKHRNGAIGWWVGSSYQSWWKSKVSDFGWNLRLTSIFFVAGFDATLTSVMFSMYELGKNQDIQKRVHDGIDRVLSEYDGNVAYGSVSAMKFLESYIEG